MLNGLTNETDEEEQGCPLHAGDKHQSTTLVLRIYRKLRPDLWPAANAFVLLGTKYFFRSNISS